MSVPHNFNIHWSNGLVTEGAFRSWGVAEKTVYASNCSEEMIRLYQDGFFKNSQDNEPIGFSFMWEGELKKFNWAMKKTIPSTVPPDHLR